MFICKLSYLPSQVEPSDDWSFSHIIEFKKNLLYLISSIHRNMKNNIKSLFKPLNLELFLI